MTTTAIATEEAVNGFPPVVGKQPHTLILGSMPGKASLAAEAYYAHPRNAFWPIMQRVYGISTDLPYADRVHQLTLEGVAVWDVLGTCVRPGSLDSDIVENTVIVNDFSGWLQLYSTIRHICFNGQTAARYWRKYVQPRLAVSFQGALSCHLSVLPSSSPAHASLSLNQKSHIWHEVLSWQP